MFAGAEAGQQGYEDPLNRRTYPWGQEDTMLLAWFRRLGQLRRERASLQQGDITYPYARGSGLAVQRRAGNQVTLAAMNAGAEPLDLTLPWLGGTATDAMTGQQFLVPDGAVHLTLPGYGGVLLI